MIANTIFRFDDICGNTNMSKAVEMVELIKVNIPDSDIWFCVSPFYHDLKRTDVEWLSLDNQHLLNVPEHQKEMVIPPILCAVSDHRAFYKVDKCLIPRIPPNVTPVSHGLFHIDHRLLPKAAQEMSIVSSASLVKSKIFVPPFNKWNKDTEEVCEEHGIELIKFEDGWTHMKYNKCAGPYHNYYLHTCDFEIADFKKWFK